MKSIECHYIGPSDTKPARIVATDGDNRIVVSYHVQNEQASSLPDSAYRRAAIALCRKLGWNSGRMIGGHTKRGMVFVWDSGEAITLGENPLPESAVEAMASTDTEHA